MEFIRNWVVMMIAVVLCSTTLVNAEAPSHRRILFSSFFWQDEENEFVSVKNIKGDYSERGWESLYSGSDGSRLLLTLKDRMPQSATLEWSIKNLGNFAVLEPL